MRSRTWRGKTGLGEHVYPFHAPPLKLAVREHQPNRSGGHQVAQHASHSCCPCPWASGSHASCKAICPCQVGSSPGCQPQQRTQSLLTIANVVGVRVPPPTCAQQGRDTKVIREWPCPRSASALRYRSSTVWAKLVWGRKCLATAPRGVWSTSNDVQRYATSGHLSSPMISGFEVFHTTLTAPSKLYMLSETNKTIKSSA